MALTVTDIIAILRQRGRGDPPSVIADLFANPLVRVHVYLENKLDLSNTQQVVDDILFALADVTTLTSWATILGETTETLTQQLEDALDGIAANFGLTRRAAAKSSGTVLLLKSANPTANIQIRVGTKVNAPSIGQDYVVTETLLIPIGGMSWNSTYGMYTYPVAVESANLGANTAANAGVVSKLKDGIAGIDGVINDQAIIGGRDLESDTSLGDRTKTALSANNIGTKSGYEALILSQTYVQDVTVVGAGDPLMIRDMGDGGSVDIYITDPIPVTITETTSAVNVSGSEFTPSRQPIINDSTTVSVAGFSPTTVAITKDTSTYAGSVSATDKISFDVAIPIGTATIAYQVNDIVSRIQDYMDDDSRKILGADILVKEAITVLVDIIATIKTSSGFSAAVVKANVEAAITQYITQLNIGVSLEQSDIIEIITDVDGVDRVDLPMTKFDRTTSSGQLNIITANANEVLRPGTITMNL